MLKGLKIDIRQKIALAFIFSLATVCIALDILRVVEAAMDNQALYTIIEINFVVIISCLPTYRALLGIGQRRKSTRPSRSYTWKSYKNGHPWRSVDGDNHPLRSVDANDAEMGGKPSRTTKDFDSSDRTRDLYPLGTLDPSILPVRMATTSHVQSRAFS